MSSGLSNSAASDSASSHALTACGECWTSALASEKRDRSAMGSSSSATRASPRNDAAKNRNTRHAQPDRVIRSQMFLERRAQSEHHRDRRLERRRYEEPRAARGHRAGLAAKKHEVVGAAVHDRM